MGQESVGTTGPDFREGIALAALPLGQPVAGHVDGEPVLLYRSPDGVHAVGGACTHYGAPLQEGMVVGEVVRCPWHHACFSLRTGEALAAPALNPLPRWRTEIAGERVRVTGRDETALSKPAVGGPASVVIVGAGAAGSSAAETLRHEGYAGRIVLVDPDADAPYDRPNLSKDYLAGTAPEEWLPLRPGEWYAEQRIERRLGRAVSLDAARRVVALSTGEELAYGALLLATGAEPIRPRLPGVERAHVLRSLADCRRLIAATAGARQVVVVGASFIGMEAAAALRARGLEVTVVAPEPVPFERTLGAELGRMLQAAHEAHGVVFRLEHTLAAIHESVVELEDGTQLPADLVLLGVGVRPRLELAAAVGLDVRGGIEVDEYLETSLAGVYAAGDIVSFPEPRTGRRARVEHWVVAQRQGQTAARNILGRGERFTAVPFFWTQQYDVAVRYVGYAPAWDALDVSRAVAGQDCAVRYLSEGELRAVATVGRDRESLAAELWLERSLTDGNEVQHVG